MELNGETNRTVLLCCALILTGTFMITLAIICSVFQFTYLKQELWYADWCGCPASALDGYLPPQFRMAEDTCNSLLLWLISQPQPFLSHPWAQSQSRFFNSCLQPLALDICQPPYWGSHVSHLPKVPPRAPSLPRSRWHRHGHPKSNWSPLGDKHRSKSHMGCLPVVLLCSSAVFSQTETPWLVGIRELRCSNSSWCCHGLFLGMEVFCLSDPIHICWGWGAPHGRSLHLRALCVQAWTRDIFLIWSPESSDLECWIPQWTPWFPKDSWKQAPQCKGDCIRVLWWFGVIYILEPGHIHVYYWPYSWALQLNEEEGKEIRVGVLISDCVSFLVTYTGYSNSRFLFNYLFRL